MKFLRDFFPVILFFIAYQLKDIYTATLVAILASSLQVSWEWWRTRRVETMHQVTLVLLLVFGGLTLLLHDPLFIKWKPTVVNWMFASAFLGSRWIGEKPLAQRLMDRSVQLDLSEWRKLNMGWTVFFLVMGGINLYVAFNYPESTWVNFKLFGMLGMTIGFIIAQAFYIARKGRLLNDPEET